MSVDDNKGSIRYLFVFYSIPIRPNVKIDRHKGTKKLRETADMVRVLPTESTKNTKTRIPMKLDDKSQQITQITQIIKSVKSVKSVDKDIKQQKTQKNTKKIRAIRVIRWQQKKKFVVKT